MPIDVVFVSGAAGAVGGAVGQVAKALGASRVIGSAGSPVKVRHVAEDLGFDAAIGSLRLGGRIAACGMISVSNDTEPTPGPRNLAGLIQTRCRIHGFLVSDHGALAPP